MFHRAKRIVENWIPTRKTLNCLPMELETELEEEAGERNEEEGKPNRKETKKWPWKKSLRSCHPAKRKPSEVS